MNPRVEERVENWGTRPFSGGHAGLRELADEAFTGVVDTDGGTWLCLLNGKVVGVFDGRIENVADAEGTAYVAPDPALPLLFAMWEQGGTQEDRYYTKDTPISEADATLSSGGFAGYLELSDNVLSGDYYVCYYGDRSLNLAFVGTNERLITGEEAFERADDEIGIYDVYSVDLEVVEVPEPEPEADAEVGAATSGAAPVEEGPSSSRPGSDPAAGDPVSRERDATGGATTRDDHEGGPPGDSSNGRSATETRKAPDRDHRDAEGTRRDRGEPVPDERSTGQDSGTTEDAVEEEPDESTDPLAGTPTDDAAPGEAGAGESDDHSPAGTAVDAERTGTDPGEATPENRSPDPASRGRAVEETPEGLATEGTGEDRSVEGESGERTATETERDRAPDDPDRERPTGGSYGEDAAGDGLATETPDRRGVDTRKGDDSPATETREDGSRLRRRVERQESVIDRLQDRIAALEADREDRRVRSDRLSDRIEEVAGDLAELRRTVMRLDRTVERLEVDAERTERQPAEAEQPEADSTLSSLSSESTASPESTATSSPDTGDGRELSVEEALQETTVLVRYGSQGKSTLKTAHGGGADAEEVNDNLQLTAHTSFDDSTATVEGQPYSAFLERRLEYRFFEWLLRKLLYEVRDTGNQSALQDLYDAIPRIDRAEFSGTVELGEEGETAQFDLVARDDRDRPLVAMNFQESRDPATEGTVVELQDRAKEVCEGAGLAAAFLVTTSYFDGAAKDAAEAATSGRILSRSSKASFVRVNRKRGFHLCLAAVSDGDFHLRTPEL
jgi:TolA-binding protein